MADMPMSEIIRVSLENIKKVVDQSTIIGEPINVLEGTVIIPISKITVGFASGGAEYSGKEKNPGARPKFGGGGGTGITISPVAFLVATADGEVRLLNINENGGYDSANSGFAGVATAIDDLLDKAPEIIDKVKVLFGKESKSSKKEENSDSRK